MPHPIVDEELALLERVRAVLEAAPRHPVPNEAPIVRDLERIREQLVSRSESKDETALTEQWHRQSALLRQLRESRDAPEVDPLSPYFAHLRLREEDRERDLCLGRATRIEQGVRIVDWRNAPVSRVFYRYRQGDDYEEEFAGQAREGQVVARRTVRIHDGKLDRIETPEGTFGADPTVEGGWQRLASRAPRLSGGEGSALRAHAVDAGASRRLGTDLDGDRRRADKRLPEITSLIDPSQFELITRPSVGFLAIRGNAGSGKTTVALHRIAYLAYEEPEIDSSLTLFVVFSAALARYVSHVLPSLGVKRVRITTYRDWAREQRRRLFPRLPAEERQDSPAIVQRLKLHPALTEALERHVAESPGPANPDQALDDWTSVLTRGELIRECCEALSPGTVRQGEIEQFCEWNRRRREEIFGWLGREPESEAALEPEDDALLLRAWQLRVGPLPDRSNRPIRYRHLAIDEVQDFAPIEVRTLIGCLDTNRSLTLAGDTQQALMQHSGFTSWSAFLAHLDIPGEALETLRLSYRSSREIVEFSASVLGGLREDEGQLEVARGGPSVELFRFTDRGACVAFLADALRELVMQEPLASVAILTPSPESSEAYHLGLANVGLAKLRRVEKQDFTFSPGIEVTEIEQAKGLEFDYVILADTSADRFPDRDSARRLLHVGATRAVHQLWLTCVGTPSPLIALPES